MHVQNIYATAKEEAVRLRGKILHKHLFNFESCINEMKGKLLSEMQQLNYSDGKSLFKLIHSHNMEFKIKIKLSIIGYNKDNNNDV
jgi:hypothetical protein